MAKLSAETIREGRQLLIGKDGDDQDHGPFYAWLKKNLPNLMLSDVMRGAFQRCFDAGDYGQACDLYDAMVENYDTREQQKRRLRKVGLVLWLAVVVPVVVATAFGSWAYLFLVLFGG